MSNSAFSSFRKPSSLSSLQIGSSQPPINPALRGPLPSSDLCGYPHTHDIHPQRYINKNFSDYVKKRGKAEGETLLEVPPGISLKSTGASQLPTDSAAQLPEYPSIHVHTHSGLNRRGTCPCQPLLKDGFASAPLQLTSVTLTLEGTAGDSLL